MTQEPKAHWYIFLTGNPHGGPWVANGHFVFDIEKGTSDGHITFKANDKSWITQNEFVDDEFVFDKDANTLTGLVEFNDIKGESPFPASGPFGPIPIDALLPSPLVPGVFIYISTSNPPQPPGPS